MRAGNRAGTSFLLDPARENRIGRGLDCHVVLTDPICSRVHAIVICREGHWLVRDGESRNGTFVNEQKTDEAVLDDGHTIRIGSTEFSFHQSEQPPTVGSANDDGMTQTVIQDAAVDTSNTAFAISAIQESEQAQDLLLLYQLSIKLLSCSDSHEVVKASLDLLKDRTNASIVGFLWIGDEGQLKPGIVMPDEAAPQVSLSESLTKLVLKEGRAVWIANQSGARAGDSLASYADGLCVPLIADERTHGAIHVYLDRGRFRQSQFDFTISLANITARALVRARRDEALQTNFEQLKKGSPGYDELVGESPVMQELKERIRRLSRATGCVLVRGESGAGKELVARALHRESPREDRPLLSVNCAAIPTELMESQLFGHKAGAFTSADRDHTGFFEQADQGTLFLDEIGELTAEGQAKLLRILDGYSFMAVGGSKEINVDVRVIAATNQDLETLVREKKFREDLYYRLSVFELRIPPLRERGDDIRRLVEFFFDRFREQHGRPTLAISEEAMKKLTSYHWPGNVRQLRNVIDSAVVLAIGNQIDVTDLGLHDVGGDQFETLRLDDWERRLIGEALNRTNRHVQDAAKLLGISRATLYRKIDEYGLKR